MVQFNRIPSVPLPASSLPDRAGAGASLPGSGAPEPFSRVLARAVEQVNALQLEAESAAQALARGEVDSLHRVTLAVERAQLAMELTMAIRNRLIEAYQEISRMQV